jgi:hypothetical protein
VTSNTVRLTAVAKLVVVLGAPWTLACAGGGALVPVFLPGERMDCLFEVVGDVTVQGPFQGGDADDDAARDAILQDVRREVGREAAGSGADAVMIRELLYDRDATSTGDAPEIVAVEGMLVSFVDEACVPGN